MHAPHDALQHHFPAQRENAECDPDENFPVLFCALFGLGGVLGFPGSLMSRLPRGLGLSPTH